ncbi:uncharacterized membrane protein HdeD (DUF308 family) [Nocardia transvalensis]|uniref:Uncharacterized membrane protein HdeD (DUF308 family) n=1 Tax=Nocardia transvalensis TaxID=37333 RepID=A0A7W9PHT7_9NOCA|nr:DUF308 domain-containing protein [Nocardia transvalensis]MBB5916404.1 uncharacterized membrane protein HdeD (DUF308 family) [Nocardia transvalensis]
MPTLRVAGRTDVFAGGAWQAALAIGVATVGLGVVILFWPDKTEQVAGLLFGACLLLTAVWQLMIAFRARVSGGLRALEFLTALIALLLAAWCLRSGDWVAVLALWIGIGWAVHGIVQAIVAVWSDDLPHAGRVEFYGLLTVLAGVLLVIWPINTLAGLAVPVGLGQIFLGGTEIRVAVRLDRAAAQGDTVGVHGLLRTQPKAG